MQFRRLRIAGFKSFVDPADIEISPGLTGIVGPNGCGKSNIVEALRWVMGESSAKQMRGAEMDDVIFSGAGARPPRNVAEVVVTLENPEKSFPTAFNDQDEIDVSRKINRGQGSTYRVNGKEVRARDLQVLFADNAIGAHAAAMVGQGQITNLINEKPTNRRALLEEAAGIAGLHVRRHEAELRLRGAESNLERLDDVLAALDEQMRGLKRQARQATRYRNVSTNIRASEAAVLYCQWRLAVERCDAARAALTAAEEQVVAHAEAAAVAENERIRKTETLPELRTKAAEASAKVQRLKIEAEQCAAEAERAVQALAAADAEIATVNGDLGRARSLEADAQAAIERLRAEQATLAEQVADADGTREAAAARVTESETELQDAEAALGDVAARLATLEAARQAHAQETANLEATRRKLDARRTQVRDELERLSGTLGDDSALAQAATAHKSAEEERALAATALETAQDAQQAARTALDAARERLQAAETAFVKVDAEATAIERMLGKAPDKAWDPVIDQVTVAAGYESALAAAFGEDLDAATDPDAPSHWRALPPLGSVADLPQGCRPLSEVVEGPDVLARRLAHIAVLDAGADAEAAVAALAPGQRLVDREGNLWRWDGLAVAAGAANASAVRLQQRNRLTELEAERATLSTARDDAKSAEMEARTAFQAADGEVTGAVGRAKQAAKAADAARAAHEAAERTHGQALARQRALTETAEDLAEQERDLETAAQELAGRRVDDAAAEALKGERDTCRATAEAARAAALEARGERDRLAAAEEMRVRRTQAIAVETADWTKRAADAAAQRGELDQRHAAAVECRAALAAAPDEWKAKRDTISGTLNDLTLTASRAGDELAAAENAARAADTAAREAEQALAARREDRVRVEAQVEAADLAIGGVLERIAAQQSCPPEALAERGEIDPDADNATIRELLAQQEGRLEKLVRERDGMGPVNLRAVDEVEELQVRIDGLSVERDDLIAAINRLRQGIASLNKEGRLRLTAAFEAVNQHFQDVFKQLFGGGSAELTLTGSDDPLEAGLEIVACPPGKKLQTLALMSGGERALTALAVTFAVFLTNPAPICVLDEVDAPLDDANVDRFCDLLQHLVGRLKTRFLLVTHHRLTMARMNRLYGVTMPEQGVSQLVSVDLGHAEQLRAA